MGECVSVPSKVQAKHVGTLVRVYYDYDSDDDNATLAILLRRQKRRIARLSAQNRLVICNNTYHNNEKIYVTYSRNAAEMKQDPMVATMTSTFI